MSSRAWSTFRAIRMVIFALAAILSIVALVISIVLLLRLWKGYSMGQRIIVITSITVNSLSTVLLYLMIVVYFRFSLDAARVALLLILQLGNTVTLAVYSPDFWCLENLGSEAHCRRVTSTLVNTGWAHCGLLLFYAFYLTAMLDVPQPQPTEKSEENMSDSKRSHSPALSTDSQTRLLKPNAERRQSHASVHSHGTFIQPLSHNPSLNRTPQPRAQSPAFVNPHEQYGAYRPYTPASFHSAAASSISSIRGFSPDPPRLPAQPPILLQQLPNPFTDVVPRYASPLSDSSDIGDYYMPAVPVVPPPIMRSPFERQDSLPLYMDDRLPADARYEVRNTYSSLTPPHLVTMDTPVLTNPPPREYTASPGIFSIASMAASLHTPNSSPSSFAPPVISAIPRGLPASPSPRGLPSNPAMGAHRRIATAPSVVLPAHPLHTRSDSMGGPVRYSPRLASNMVSRPSPGPSETMADSRRHIPPPLRANTMTIDQNVASRYPDVGPRYQKAERQYQNAAPPYQG